VQASSLSCPVYFYGTLSTLVSLSLVVMAKQPVSVLFSVKLVEIILGTYEN